MTDNEILNDTELICAGRVVVVTGAGRGIGRAYALELARHGAKVVVNDLGGALAGGGADSGPSHEVVAEIIALGGEAVADQNDISDWAGAERTIQTAIDTFGSLDVLVNNAGILRDRSIVKMTESDWDDVVRVHLKGTAATTHHAAKYWREQSKSGAHVEGRIINTSSASGLFGNFGQSNYGSAKAAIAGLTLIAATELKSYGVTVNAVYPSALTRLAGDVAKYANDEELRLQADPVHITPLVTWLASALSAGVTGKVFGTRFSEITVAEGWKAGPRGTSERPFTVGDMNEIVPALVASARGNADIWGDVAVEVDQIP